MVNTFRSVSDKFKFVWDVNSGSSSTPGAGATYVAGTTVTLTDNGVALGTAQVDGNGNWSTQVTLPNQGQNAIVATDTDIAGNVGTSSSVVDTLDSIVPSVSLTSTGGTTNAAVQTISGSSSTPGAGATYVAGTTVTLTDNGVALGTAQVDGNGNWSTQVTLPNQGQNAIVATDTDIAGNVGTNSVNYHLLTPPTVAFDGTTAAFVNGVTPIMTGSVSSYSGVASVEIYEGDPTNGGQDLGAATVNGDGTWIFQTNIGAGDFNSLTAVATDASGETSTNTAPYELVTGITGEPYRAQEFDSMSDGSYSYTDFSKHGTPLVDASDNGDGTHTIEGSGANGQIFQSIGNDTMTGYGVSERFVFVPHFGQDEVTDFAAVGQTHDTIDLTDTHFSTLAQVLRNTTMSGGSAEIHLNPQDTITLDGVTKAQLKAHPGDFVFA